MPVSAVTIADVTDDTNFENMPDDVQSFLSAFQKMSEAAARFTMARVDGDVLADRLAAHLGVRPSSLPVVTEVVTPLRVIDADVALEHVVAAFGGGEALGIGGGDQRWHMSLSEMLQNSQWNPFPIGPIDYVAQATGPDSERNVVLFGLRLFVVDGVPVAILQRGMNPQYGAEPKLEILSPEPATTVRVLEEIRAAMTTHSVLRGKVVSFSASPFEPGSGGVTFLPRPQIGEDAIVLPAGLLHRVRRHVLGIGERAAELRALGQHLKRGVLLYGPPGTGKTLTVRHLVGQSEATVIMLAGRGLAAIGLAAATARALEPAIVVLEDCDLIAEERDPMTSSPMLFEVLDALDGLAADADVTFLLTTNRVDALEPALAQRPGRVDLAVEVPLPDEASRRALLDVYASHLSFSTAALDETARRTAGTTASFARELVRRAVLSAAEAGRQVGDTDLLEAVSEIMSDAEAITRSMLGGGDGADSAADEWSEGVGFDETGVHLDD